LALRIFFFFGGKICSLFFFSFSFLQRLWLPFVAGHFEMGTESPARSHLNDKLFDGFRILLIPKGIGKIEMEKLKFNVELRGAQCKRKEKKTQENRNYSRCTCIFLVLQAEFLNSG
jgi:hypothetical protein